MPSAFVSVSMLAAATDGKSQAAVAGYVERFIKQTGWTPRLIHMAAGARRYSRHNPLGRWILRYVDRKSGFAWDTTQDHEWTDWQALGRFADTLIASAAQPSASRDRIGSAAVLAAI
jgi:menaquinone-dependent protoporphyrinogen oxidase